MFHDGLCTIQSKKFFGDFHVLVIGYQLAVQGDDIIMPPLSSFFLGLDTLNMRYI